MRFIIHSVGGSVKATTDTINYNGEFLGDRYLSVSVLSGENIALTVGDYIEYRGEKFTICIDPTVQKNAKIKSAGNAIQYDNVRFESAAYELKTCDFLDEVISDNHVYTSFLPTFSFWANTVRDLGDKIQANLDRKYGKNVWHVVVDKVDTNWNTDVDVSVNNINCFDAVKLADSEFGTDFYIDSKSRTVYLGSLDNIVDKHRIFEFGKDRGLTKIKKEINQSQQVVTALHAYGNSTNLPNKYYVYKNGWKGTYPIKKWRVEPYQKEGLSHGYVVYFDAPELKGVNLNKLSSTIVVHQEQNARQDGFGPINEYRDGTQLEDCTILDWTTIFETDGIKETFSHFIMVNSWNSFCRLVVMSMSTRTYQPITYCSIWPVLFRGHERIDEQLRETVGKGAVYLPFLKTLNLRIDNTFFKSEFEATKFLRTNKELYDVQPVGNSVTDFAAVQNLMLPEFPIINADGSYSNPILVDEEATKVYGVREKSIFFDGSDDTEDIYPTITGISAQNLIDAGYATAANYPQWVLDRQGVDSLDKVKVNKFLCDNDRASDDGTIEPGKEEDKVFVGIWTTYLGFNPLDCVIDSNTYPKVNITSGACAGMSFEIHDYAELDENGTIRYWLKLKRAEESSLGLWFPNKDAEIKMNDTYTITDINMPDLYVEAAAQRLKDAALAWLADNNTEDYKISVDIDKVWMQRDMDANGAASIGANISEGDIMHIVDTDLGLDRQIVITKITIKNKVGTPADYTISFDDEISETFADRINRVVKRHVEQTDVLATAKNRQSIKTVMDAAVNMAEIEAAIDEHINERALRKDEDDATPFNIKLGTIEVEGNATVGGDLNASENIYAKKNVIVGGDADVSGNIQTTGNVEVGIDLTINGTSRLQTTTFGTPQEAPGGVGTINGAEITKGGGIKARSLELSEFLEVPEIRFNRASLIVGTNIQSPCAGIIKTVSPIDEFTGIATLELGDDDIAGSIQEGALCWGYFHDTERRENNATESSDDRQGNIEYHGFATVYFQIAHIYSPVDGDYPNNSSVFRYELREGYHLHPYPAMHFGGRGNTKDTNLQGFTIKTPDYEATYQNVGSWDWSDLAKYVVKVQGKLDGFESLAGMKPGTWKNHYGTIETNLYYRGELKQVDLGRSFLFITQESNGMLEEDETEKVTIVIRNQSFGIATAAYNISVNGVAHSIDEGTEALVLEYPYADLADELTRYTVVCTHKADATQKLEGSFTIRKLAPRTLKIESDQQNDPFISTDAPRHVEFRVVTNTGLDLTGQVTKWTITRESSNADADKIWALRDKAKNFQGIIDIYWSYDAAKNDIDLNAPITKFYISATVGTETLNHKLEI